MKKDASLIYKALFAHVKLDILHAMEDAKIATTIIRQCGVLIDDLRLFVEIVLAKLETSFIGTDRWRRIDAMVNALEQKAALSSVDQAIAHIIRDRKDDDLFSVDKMRWLLEQEVYFLGQAEGMISVGLEDETNASVAQCNISAIWLGVYLRSVLLLLSLTKQSLEEKIKELLGHPPGSTSTKNIRFGLSLTVPADLKDGLLEASTDDHLSVKKVSQPCAYDDVRAQATQEKTSQIPMQKKSFAIKPIVAGTMFAAAVGGIVCAYKGFFKLSPDKQTQEEELLSESERSNEEMLDESYSASA